MGVSNIGGVVSGVDADPWHSDRTVLRRQERLGAKSVVGIDFSSVAIAGLLESGGRFYIRDVHPFFFVFEDVDGDILARPLRQGARRIGRLLRGQWLQG